MQTYSLISELQDALSRGLANGRKLAFVPTMGNLHEGHISLVKRAKKEADAVIVSIFVNPLQFGANEDLDKYPRTLEADKEKLVSAGVDFLFTPAVEEIYPEGMASQTQVCVPFITEDHCGASRPGHFDGVSTVVTKLFNIVQPDVAIFGEKDFQQLAVIRKMVNDLCIPVEIIGSPTGRAENGLALSSRNQYLNEAAQKTAPLLYQTLLESQKALQSGSSSPATIAEKATKTLEDAGFRVDYFNIVDADNLKKINDKAQKVVILAAAFLGKTRLIDNVCFTIDH